MNSLARNHVTCVYCVVECVVWRISELERCCGSVVVSCCCEKLISEVGDHSRTQRKGNVRRWKPLPNNGSGDMTVDTTLCV
jgi:hypothetical protein